MNRIDGCSYLSRCSSPVRQSLACQWQRQRGNSWLTYSLTTQSMQQRTRVLWLALFVCRRIHEKSRSR